MTLNAIVVNPDGSTAYEPSLIALEATDDAIRKLTLELNALKATRDGILQACLAANIDVQGDRKLMCKTRTVREVAVDLFKEKFPGAYNELKAARAREIQGLLDDLVEHGLKEISPVKAEELVGKIPLFPTTIPHDYKTYSVVVIPGDRE